jgi:hypothetical protein
VAVKQLFNESQQSIDEFLNEIVLITGVKHRNLVKLKGCCITTSKKRLLVYEYVENNDLDEALFGEFINLKNIYNFVSDNYNKANHQHPHQSMHKSQQNCFK